MARNRKDVLGLSEMMAKSPKPGDQAAASPDAPPAPPPDRKRGSAFEHGAVGGMRTTLMESAARSVQDIDTAKIREFGPNDRLDVSETSVGDLVESIRERGQHVPVMLRPDPEDPTFYQVVFGRRRIMAARALGIPVKALIRTLGNDELIVARGQENALRLDPSYIEKVLFMRGLDAEGYDTVVVRDALGTDKTTLSRMRALSGSITEGLIRWIGPAPGVGRRRWIELAEAIAAAQPARPDDVMSFLPETDEADSDRRFELALNSIAGNRQKKSRTPALPASRPITLDGVRVAETRRHPKGLVMTVFSGDDPAFATWIETNATRLIEDARAAWKEDNDK